MSEVLRDIDDRMQEVEVFADGSFKAVQRTTPTEAEIIDDEDPYVPDPDSDTEPIVKAEVNNDNLDEPVETALSLADEGQLQAYPLAAEGEEQSREPLHRSRSPSAMLCCVLGSANSRVEQAEPDVAELRDNNYRLGEEPAAMAHDTHEITDDNQQRARLDVMPTAAEAAQQTDHEPIESESFSMDADPHESSRSLFAGDAGNDGPQATIDNGALERGQPLPEHDHDSSSDASIPLLDLSDATSMEGDSDLEGQPGHAPKQSDKTQKNHFACAECGRAFNRRNGLSRHQRTHSGEKPYKCAHCGKAFAEAGSLRKHEYIHTGEKPHKCTNGHHIELQIHPRKRKRHRPKHAHSRRLEARCRLQWMTGVDILGCSPRLPLSIDFPFYYPSPYFHASLLQ